MAFRAQVPPAQKSFREMILAYTIYDACVPPLIHMLGSFHSVLAKGEAHAKETGVDPNSYLELRLAPDMLPMTAQVRIATDMSKGGAARLANVDIPKYEDDETTVEQLKARLLKTIAFLKSLDAAKFAGAEDRHIHLKFPQAEFNFNGKDYLNNWVLPNVYFHITTGYDILRHKGVALGKQDFLGGQK
jgi:uncharacterized protein